jgi:hypothetical protein
MIIGVNEKYQIKQIREVTDPTLTIIELDENAENYPFTGWSDAKILCYYYKVDDESIAVYPYIDTNIIEKIEADNQKILQARADIDYVAIMTGVDL